MVGIGSNSSRSGSESQSVGYGEQGSQSLSESIGRSRSTSSGSSSQAIAFENLFAQLYGGASNVAGQLAQKAPQLTQQAQQLFSGGTQFLEQLGGGVDTAYLESRLQGNPMLNEQIGALGDDIGRFFREEVNPAITSRAVAGGTLGGGRQGVAQGRAADAAGREFTTGAMELRSADLAQRDAAAQALQAGRIGSAQAGLGALPGLFNLAQGGFNAELSPYAALASIMGGPTTLTQSQTSAQASSQDIARAISEAFGFNFDKSNASSYGRSSGFNFSVLGG